MNAPGKFKNDLIVISQRLLKNFSFQQFLQKTFMVRSLDRQKRINEASKLRKEIANQRRAVAKKILDGVKEPLEAVSILRRTDGDIHAFSPNTMKRETLRS